jgi:hypothetical protein
LIMRRKLHAIALVLVMSAGLFGFNGGAPAPARAAASGSAESLLSLLPASDFIAYCDARQGTSVVLPAILAQRPEWQDKIDRDFADFQRDTGVDPRSFDAIAVGVGFNGRSAGRGDPNFVVIARGSFDAAAAIDAAFAAQAKKSQFARVKREIEYSGRTIFVAARPTGDDNGQAKGTPYGDRELAALVFDGNTIAFGDLAGMRAVVDSTNGKGRVDDELIALATRTPGAVAGFAGNLPSGMSDIFIGGHGGDNDLGKAIAGIKQVYGSVSSAGTDFDSHVTLRTDNTDQARSIGQMINALKLFTKTSDQKGRRSAESLLHDLNVKVEGNEIDLTLLASFTDLMGVAHGF